MIAMTLHEIADIVGGELHGDPAAVVDAPVEFDSRRIAPGGLFLAFAGEHADGHDFVAGAIRPEFPSRRSDAGARHARAGRTKSALVGARLGLIGYTDSILGPALPEE